jgi:hypothetical protein
MVGIIWVMFWAVRVFILENGGLYKILASLSKICYNANRAILIHYKIFAFDQEQGVFNGF